MPQGPIIPAPQIPVVADPRVPAASMNLQRDPNTQVLEMLGSGLLKRVVSLLGLDDPQQVMAVAGVPIETGPMSGGVVEAIATRFPRFTQALKTYLSPTDAPFYSRLNEAVAALPKQAAPAKVLSLGKGAAAPEELAVRGVPQFVAKYGTKPVPKADLLTHLEQNPIKLNVKTLGVPQPVVPGVMAAVGDQPLTTAEARRAFEQGQRVHWYRPADAVRVEVHAPESFAPHSAYAQDVDAGIGEWRTGGTPQVVTGDELPYEAGLRQAEAIPTKFSTYQVPGGENYRETLITLPTKQPAASKGFTLKQTAPHNWVILDDAGQAIGASNTQAQAQLNAEAWLAEGGQNPFTGQYADNRFISSHFDEPNILVHTRSNEREIPGVGKGTFLEEVQSDWHQKGKTKGYQVGENLVDGQNYQFWENKANDLFNMKTSPHLRSQFSDADMARIERDLATARTNRDYLTTQAEAVPDAPFKESWPDLALKHHLAEAAQNPQTQWLGFTSGQTQAARYDLSKQIKSFDAFKNVDGTYNFIMTPIRSGPATERHIVHQIRNVTESELAETIGKDLADKVRLQEVNRYKTYSDVDLQVGGEGMHYFYDTLLPKRLEKIVKPFGGTVERMTVEQTGNKDLTGSWIVRLTPELKQRLLKEGFPLLTGLGFVGAAASQRPKE